MQHQRSVGYVFAGSEPSLMERMLGPKRPFYKAGPVMRLEKIPPDLFSAFIESRFSKTGIKPEAGLGASIVDLAGNMPYDVQRLAHESWDDARAAGKRRIGVDDLHATLHRLLAEQDTMFEAVWQRLTLAQRATLRAVVLADGRELLSADLRDRYRLGGASTVQAALQALAREDLVAREGDALCRRRFPDARMDRPKNLLATARAASPRDSRVGDVRLGELGVRHHHHHRDFPGVLHVGGRRRPPARRSDAAARPHDDDCAGDVGAPRAVSRRAGRLRADQEAAARAVHGDRLHRRRLPGARAPRRLAAGRRLLRHRQHRIHREPHVLRFAPAAYRARRTRSIACRRRGYALGYLGGGVLLALNVAWILSPATFGLRDAAQASRLSFASVALWWSLFSIPLFRRVPEPTIARRRATLDRPSS